MGEDNMTESDLLKGKKILIVDDEPDVLDTLEDLLPMCDTVKASNFKAAQDYLETEYFDMAILDIMGVKGFDLLEIAIEKGIPALMLTAHGLNPDNLVGSIKLGAKSYIPKEKMSEIDLYLKEIFIAQKKGIEKSGNWFAHLKSFFDNRFGTGWHNKDKKFWR